MRPPKHDPAKSHCLLNLEAIHNIRVVDIPEELEGCNPLSCRMFSMERPLTDPTPLTEHIDL
jgi:hypothetical protein